MEVTLALLADFANHTSDGKLNILGVYDDSDDGVRSLIRRLRAEAPDLAPRPVLASAGSDGPPSGPRHAVSGLSDA